MTTRKKQSLLSAVKCLALLLALTGVFLFQADPVHAAEFDITDGTLNKYNGSATVVTVPDGVTCIGERAFAECMNLESVQLPDTVKTIEESAFYYCNNLSTVQNLENVTSFGIGAFEHCLSLQDIKLNPNLTEIPDFMFYYTRINGDFDFPAGLKTIGQQAFYACVMDEVTLPSGLESIGNKAFGSCHMMTLTIPSSVKTIGDYCFNWNEELTNIYYKGTSSQWKAISIGDGNDSLTKNVIHCTDKDINTGGGSSTCVIKFNANGGTCKITSKSLSAGGQLGTMPTATKSGYYLNGWYTKKSGGTKITGSSTINQSMTLYAHWTVRKSLAKAKVTVSSPTYDGSAKTPAVTVKLSGKTLKKGTDYKVTYSNNVNASSKAVAKITGINKYKGSVTKKFTIKKHGMDKKSVTAQLSKTSYEYTGKEIKPGITVYFHGKKMKKGTDYKVSYLSNKAIGKGYVKVTGMGNFTSTARLFGFTITKATQPFTTSVTKISKAHQYIGTSSTITVSGVKEFAKVTASSSNVKVAKVTKTLTGKFTVKFVGVGTADISFQTAATKHYKATVKNVKVTVADRKEPTLQAEQTEYKLKPVKDSSFSLKASTNSDGKLTYESSNPQIATVSSKGVVTLTGEMGETTITITVPQTKSYKQKTLQVRILTYQYPHINFMTAELDANPFFQYDTGAHAGDCSIASIAILRTMRGNGKTAADNYNDVWSENGGQSYVQSWAALGLTDDYDVSLEHIYQIMSERHTPVVIHRYNDNNTHFSVIYAYVGDTSTLQKEGFLVYDVKDVVYEGHYADNLAKWDNYRGEGSLQKIVY